MHNCLRMAATALLIAATTASFSALGRWGADYFPNIPLTTHDGKTVRFFDDLIKDKVVAVNFIYTKCPDTCPLETAQLVQVQNILGERLGKDVFFYSISIDPEHDTPEVLSDYRKLFRANWTFLTGKEEDITRLRKKLGLYIAEIQDGSNNHNVNMIIGNQKTGRWMKRSPFENPHVLADQIGNWLTDWKSMRRQGPDYAQAPQLRNIPRGEQIFRTRCAACHSLTGIEPEGALGPDLLGVTQHREADWLLNWLRAPDQMLADKDPIAVALFNRYNELPMPNMRLNKEEALALLEYIDEETRRLAGVKRQDGDQTSVSSVTASETPIRIGATLAILDPWVREAHKGAKANAGYLTLVNGGASDVALVKVESDAFERVELHEMAMVDGLMEMRELRKLVIPAKRHIRLEPGGIHLMMIGPREQFAAGQTVDLTVTLESGKKQTLAVKVASR